MPVSGYAGRYPVNKGDDFSQARAIYHSFSEKDKSHLIDNIAVELKDVSPTLLMRIRIMEHGLLRG